MKAILLAAALFAILRTAAPNTGSPLRVFMAYWPWISCGALLGVITAITASWIGLRALPWYVRLLVILVVGAAAGATLEFFPALGMLADLVQSQPDVTNGFNFCTTMAFTLAMAAWLAVALAAGWTLRARPQPIATQDAVGTDAPPRRSLVRVATWGVAASVLAALGTVYWNLLPPQPPRIELPNPNGYDEIIKATGLLNWNAIPGQDIEETSVENCRAFAADNQKVLALVRRALQLPSHTPVVYDATQFSLVGIQNFREMARALVAAARAAAADNRHGDAARIYVDIMRLGPALPMVESPSTPWLATH